MVFFTTHLSYNVDFIKKFLVPNGLVIHATENDLPSDDYGVFMRLLFKFYVDFKRLGAIVLGSPPNWANEPHLCFRNLDQLANYVNEEILNTVVSDFLLIKTTAS